MTSTTKAPTFDLSTGVAPWSLATSYGKHQPGKAPTQAGESRPKGKNMPKKGGRIRR